ncbi:MAG: hypothetical protein IKU86_05460, partial [Thermoguttaceae bacterium]|nr:hypothetical protein [Thermoguttaceae bacterium]
TAVPASPTLNSGSASSVASAPTPSLSETAVPASPTLNSGSASSVASISTPSVSGTTASAAQTALTSISAATSNAAGAQAASSASGASASDLAFPTPRTSYVTTPVGRYGGSRRLNAAAFATKTSATSSSPVASGAVVSSSPVASGAVVSSSPVASGAVVSSSPVASGTVSSVPSASVPVGVSVAPASNAVAAAPVGYREYVTKEGDNLLTIAENELGSSSRWGEIKRLNNFRSGATYFDVGTTIKLPLGD